MKTSRRQFVEQCALGAAAFGARTLTAADLPVPRSLFDGKSLAGWHAVPRLTVPKDPRFSQLPTDQLRAAVVRWHQADAAQHERLEHTGSWRVEDGAIIGGQQPEKRLGAYLLTDEKFGDFDLTIEARPDWPVDTGIMVRAHELGGIGFQVLLDHRPDGGVAGVFGNNIGNFLAAPFTINGDKEPGFRVTNLRPGGVESQFAAPRMQYAATFADFVKVWRLNDWNRIRIRCQGELPVITTWVNDLKICVLDTAGIQTPGFDAGKVRERLGPKGHIGFEVHDVNPKNPLGDDRWARGAVCRWRKVMITEL
jgi:hypothetical protein